MKSLYIFFFALLVALVTAVNLRQPNIPLLGDCGLKGDTCDAMKFCCFNENYAKGTKIACVSGTCQEVPL